MTDNVQLDRDGHVARIVLNNPDKHNALGEEELSTLQNHLAEVEADSELRVLVVTGRGDKTFCAGAALHQLGSGRISGDFFQ